MAEALSAEAAIAYLRNYIEQNYGQDEIYDAENWTCEFNEVGTTLYKYYYDVDTQSVYRNATPVAYESLDVYSFIQVGALLVSVRGLYESDESVIRRPLLTS